MKTYTVTWEEYFDPTERHLDFDSLCDAVAFAAGIAIESGYVKVRDEYGNEYIPF